MGCTALGTGVGKLDPRLVADRMVDALIESDTDIAIVFCDHNANFIAEIKVLLNLS